MGCDMFILRVSKPELEDRIYGFAELWKNSYNVILKTDSEEQRYHDILAYTKEVLVINKYYDMEKIISDYNLLVDSTITGYYPDMIYITGRNGKETIRKEISKEEINDKYTLSKQEVCLVYKSEQVSYWRNDEKIRDFFYKNYPVENCGYNELGSFAISEFNKKFNENIPVEDPTEEGALFYYEWY